jgi:2-furoate---CoA ligase
MDLKQVVERVVERSPSTLALCEGESRLTYGDWLGDLYALASSLRTLDVGHGDRIAIAMRNSIEHATVSVATLFAGAAGVPFNFRAKPVTIRQILADSDARMLVFDDASLKDQLGEVDGLRWVYAGAEEVAGCVRLADLVASGERDDPGLRVSSADLCHILYTSGTTGEPKGVPHTHGHVWERMQGWLMHFGPPVNGQVRTLGMSPLYHIAGLHCVYWLTVLLMGGYFPVREYRPDAVLDLIEREELTYLVGSPTVFDGLLTVAEHGERVFPSVSHVVFASAPRPPRLIERLQRAFPTATIAEAYGTGEGVMFGSVDAVRKPGAFQTVGDMRARVIRPHGSPEEELPFGEEGELIVELSSGRMVDGYWRRPELTADRFRHGWSYTGDAFVRDEDGHFFISGRLDDMFISGGENIQPTEIELVLARHPGVADVAVIGTPDPRWGELCTAFVVRADESLSAEDLDAFCRDSDDLADYKRPRRVFFVDEIARNPTGKILRKELRALYLEGRFDAAEGELTTRA